VSTAPPEVLVGQAQALEGARRWPEAIALYERALALRPDLADTWYNLGRLRRYVGRYAAALAAYDEALARGVSMPEEVRLNRAVIYSDYLHRPDDAERELQAALAVSPDYAPALLNLGNLHEDRGRRDAARGCYERILARDPAHVEALARLAGVSGVAAPGDPLVARLHGALQRTDLEALDRATLGFALGRLLDACCAYDDAFEAYAEANRASAAARQPHAPPYDPRALEQLVERQIAVFSSADAIAAAPSRDRAPVFICGMFRSGSTLAERVLAAHPRVTAGGELDWLPQLVERLAPYPETMRHVGADGARRLADAYRAARHATFPGADVLTDKRPDNFLYVGLIKTMFPDAKIVHTVREPLDNVLSVHFLHLDASMAYATDLLDTAHHLLQSRRLMAHWKALWPDDVLDFDYDAFVHEPRPAVERLLAFCGLEWDERCLEFHRAGGVVRTASVWQVREPLYRRSSGRWRNYERQLAGVREYLSGDGAARLAAASVARAPPITHGH
jgi:tetratricopeptide (TPR) repeat protein